MKKIFIDGRNGTTGLRIDERLLSYDDVEIIVLPEEKRKDPIARKQALNSADFVFLCLPDVASIEAVSMIENPNVCVIDTSTAHRTNKDWAYGFPELDKEFEEKIKNSNRIAVPGCHASGVISLIYPLVKNGIISPDTVLTCYSLTGYSGGGKKMIAEYEAENRNPLLKMPRAYALSGNHKHLPEITMVCGLNITPCFLPVVCDFYSGMEVTIPLFKKDLIKGGMEDIKNIYKELYNSSLVKYSEDNEDGFLSAGKLSNKDNMIISVFGNEERILLTSRYDNLGKGASGAAIECLNIKLGNDKTKTLNI